MSPNDKTPKPKNDPSGLENKNFNFLKEALQFNPQNSQIAAANTDWLLMRGSMFRDVMQCLKEKSGNIIIEETAEEVGEKFAEYLKARKMDSEEIPTILDLLINQGGWGKAKLTLNPKAKSGVITIENCIAARQIHTDESNCYFIKGYIKGLFKKLYQAPIECTETNCMAKGDPVCVFEFKPTTNKKRAVKTKKP